MGRSKKSIFFLFIALYLFTNISFAQNKLDSLQQKTYLELFEDLNSIETLEEKNYYGNVIIEKAKKENNKEFLIAGYHTLAILHDTHIMLKYCDSIIGLTEVNSDVTYPAEAFRLKGSYYFNSKDYKRALNNYLKVSYYAKKHNDKKLIFKSNYCIGTIKRIINEKEKALKLYKENFTFAKKNLGKQIDTINYINSIAAIANIFNDMELGDSSSIYNKLGFKEARNFNNEYFMHHFSLNEGVSMYYKNKYKEAIDSLEKHIPFFENTKDRDNLSIAYYYSGSSYAKINNIERAVLYYKKVDTIFKETKTSYPVYRLAYSELISYYKQKNDLRNQLVYINQLIKVDSTLNDQLLYLNKRIFKDYDIPKLKSEKGQIINKMNQNKTIYQRVLYVFLFIILFSIVAFFYQYRKRKVYKNKFLDILNSKNDIKNDITIKEYKALDISEEIIKKTLKGLEEFEQSKSFLLPNVSLNSLATELNTNSNYLSKIINHYKNQSFSNYINTLRIEYFIIAAKTDSTLRKYTIKAIASEVGFKNSESFSKAFNKIKGIKPSYFIKEINKLKDGN